MDCPEAIPDGQEVCRHGEAAMADDCAAEDPAAPFTRTPEPWGRPQRPLHDTLHLPPPEKHAVRRAGARRSTARTIKGHKVHTIGVIGRGRFRASPLTGRVAPGVVAVSPRVAPLLPSYWSRSGYGCAPSVPQWRGESPRVSCARSFTKLKKSPHGTLTSDMPRVYHHNYVDRRHYSGRCSLLHIAHMSSAASQRPPQSCCRRLHKKSPQVLNLGCCLPS